MKRCHKSSLGIILVAALSAASIFAQKSPTADHKANIEAATWPIGFPGPDQKQLKLVEWMRLLSVPGISVAVIQDYKIAWTAQYGLADVNHSQVVIPDTLFQAGSISKAVNAFGLMRLVDGGQLSLDENVNRKLKTWKVPENEFTDQSPVTLRRILSHTARFTVHGFDGYTSGAPLPTLVQILNGEKPANSSPVRVQFVPGSKFQYSGGGVLVSQLLLTDVTNQPYDKWMQQNVLDPISMRDSSFQNPLSKSRLALTSTGYRGDGNPVDGRWHIYPEMAAAGLWTTPTDLAKFGIEIMRALRGESRLLSQSAAERMLTEQKDGAALGFMVDSKSGEFGHNGSDEGFQAMLVCFRNGNGAAVMMNSDTGNYVAQRLLWAIAREYAWDYPIPTRQAFPDVVFTMTMRDGAAKAIAETRKILQEPEQPLPHGPRFALNAAIGLIDARRWQDALALLDFQLETTPNSDDVYVARAHTYRDMGDRKQAILAVKRALELNPRNDSAKALLDELEAPGNQP